MVLSLFIVKLYPSKLLSSESLLLYEAWANSDLRNITTSVTLKHQRWFLKKSWRFLCGIRTIHKLSTNQEARRDSAPINERPIGTFSVLCFAFLSANDWNSSTSHDPRPNSAWGTCEISMYFLSQFFFFQRFNETSLFNRVMRIGSKHPVLINIY